MVIAMADILRIDPSDNRSVYRVLAIIVSVSLILFGSLLILWPFVPAIMLAIIFTLSTWPAFAKLESRMHGQRLMAALSMTLLLVACFVAPIYILGSHLADNFGHLYSNVIQPILDHPGRTPVWIKDLPWLGPRLEDLWQERVAQGLQNSEQLRDTLRPKLLAAGAAIGHGLLDLTLGVIIAFFLFLHGRTVVERINLLIEKCAGPRGPHLMTVTKKTIVGIVYGVLGTAVAQGVLAGLGFWIAGIPGATFLGLMTILLSFIPLGPVLLWVPAAAWLFSNGQDGMGIFMVIWGIVFISAADNVIRPYFISLGSSLPLLLVLLGVFGGLLTFGFIGLFIGPTLLAISYTLINEWSAGDKALPAGSSPA
jgi:predicted PurR-regulated permease PerM